MAIPIQNAADVPLSDNPGTLPNVSGALLDWFQPMNFKLITKTVVDFNVVETFTLVNARGVRQPMKPQVLELKPFGQHRWKWETMHTLPETVLVPDDVIDFKGVRYRVMQKLDYTEYGYLEYHIAQDDLPENYAETEDGDALLTQSGTGIVIT